MRLKDALANVHKEHSEDTLIPLYTIWGENLNRSEVRQEYPRPQMRRSNYRMLHGEWDYSFVSEKYTGEFCSEGKILVPFSPESLLSGVKRQLKPTERLWYQRTLQFSSEELKRKEKGERCILHFDAVDQQAIIYVDNKEVKTHYGGYLPFEVDITEFVREKASILQVCVKDESDTSYHTRGKQTLKRGGMFYTAQSGIWQSVWYEWVPQNYVKKMRITPKFDEGKVLVELDSAKSFSKVEVIVKDADVNVQTREITREYDCVTEITVAFENGNFEPWSPETPHLYEFAVTAGEDTIDSYFAMRSFTIEKDEEGIPRFFLNHKPYFVHGVLDQGYWPDGLMTAPSDEAFVFDIALVKKLGFNMIRKHIKIEPLRWYYHCDRMGMLVWQDMVNGGSKYNMLWACYLPTALPLLGKIMKDNLYGLFSRKSDEGRRLWEEECIDTVEHLYNVPSLTTWVPFNEAWGQFDAARIAQKVKENDSTRTVDHASGWYDQKAGDFNSVHNYFRKLKVHKDKKRAFVISEYGGYACHIEGHSSVERIFGYKKYESKEELTRGFSELLKEQLYPLIAKGLSGAVYTQVSDVEEEVNGLVTYDRKIIKIDRGEEL